MPNTPILDLPYPTHSEPADVPVDIQELAEAIEALGAAGGLGNHPGDIKMSAATAPPGGWLLCDGAAVDRGVYADLFNAIGTAYGAGDGSTTFNLPDFLDAFPKGANTPADVGGRGGEASHVLTVDEMPSHAHGPGAGPYFAGTNYQAQAAGGTVGAFVNSNFATTGFTGASGAHNNLPPFVAVNFFVKF